MILYMNYWSYHYIFLELYFGRYHKLIRLNYYMKNQQMEHYIQYNIFVVVLRKYLLLIDLNFKYAQD